MITGIDRPTASEIKYVAERDEIAANRTITTIALLGFVIVAMSMVGPRTRSPRTCSSARARSASAAASAHPARDVRRIFTTEGVALALAGWLLGIPLGYALTA